VETAIVVPVESAELLLSAAATAFGFDRPPGVPAHVTLLYPFVDAGRLVVGHAHEAQRAFQTFNRSNALSRRSVGSMILPSRSTSNPSRLSSSAP
jgi:hypothetical protein